MSRYQVDFTYKIQEWGSVELEANSVEEAELLGIEYVKEVYDEVIDVEVEGVREVKSDAR